MEHYTRLVFFLLWLERDNPSAMYGTHRISDVVDSLAFILGKTPEELRKIVD